MTGTIELSDQDIQDLILCINDLPYMYSRELELRLENLKERLLKVEVNEQ